MARKMTEWPSKRGPITKIMPSDGCIGDTVPLAVGKWYEFHEFGWHMGNVGYTMSRPIAEVEDWLETHCGGVWSVMLEDLDDGLERKTIRVLFEIESDKQKFMSMVQREG